MVHDVKGFNNQNQVLYLSKVLERENFLVKFHNVFSATDVHAKK